MYIFAIHLKHFRSFENLWVFPREDVNVLVGPNNCGKTTILRALALVLDPSINIRQSESITRFDFHAMNLDQPIELWVWLRPKTKLVPTIDGKLQTQFDELDEVKESFFDKLSEWSVKNEARVDLQGFEEHHPIELNPFTVEPMENPANIPTHEKLLALKLQAIWNAEQEGSDVEVNIVDQMDSQQYQLTVKHKDLIGFKLLGTRRNPIFEMSLARRSVLSKMVAEEEVTQALRKLLLDLDNSKQSLLKQKSIDALINRLGTLVAPELMRMLTGDTGNGFTLTFLSGDLWRLRGATAIATNLTGDPDNSRALPLEYQGDGVQNLLLLFHLIDLLSEGSSNTIVGLEEPEQNLEPALARWVFGELCSLSRDDGNRRGQIFVTTHSPALVNELKGSESLIIFTEELPDPTQKDVTTKWRTISAHFLSPMRRKILDQRRDKYVPTLFAHQVLIVEGASEVGFLPVAFRHLARNKPHENPYHFGLEVMEGDNNDQAPKHAAILHAYGRKCHVLLDYDIPDKTADARKTRFDGSADFVTSWPCKNLLPFTRADSSLIYGKE
jgi:energy-coupling factor transporter ATP-binding protein EcfA2